MHQLHACLRQFKRPIIISMKHSHQRRQFGNRIKESCNRFIKFIVLIRIDQLRSAVWANFVRMHSNYFIILIIICFFVLRDFRENPKLTLIERRCFKLFSSDRSIVSNRLNDAMKTSRIVRHEIPSGSFLNRFRRNWRVNYSLFLKNETKRNETLYLRPKFASLTVCSNYSLQQVYCLGTISLI